MIRCIAIDDEPLALRQITKYIEQTPFLTLSGAFTSALEGLSYLNENEIDLLFVDIQMPNLNGLDLVKSLIKRPKIIFTTAYSEYAIDGFQLDVLDYILKPLDYASFLKSANKAQSQLQRENNEKLSTGPDHIFIKSEYRIVRIELDKILYIEGSRGYLRFFLENAKPVMTLLSMKKIEAKLLAAKFLRVHRSFIVNVDKITMIERSQIIFDDVRIPVSEQYKERFQKYIDDNFVL